MRNLKKVLSLALALVMLLGMMVVGAGAATSFKDDADIKNQEAVAVLVGMGIMKGRGDGTNFEPAGTLTRAEAAKMIAQLDLGVEAADALVGNGTSPFSDVWSGYWAEGAIDYCVEQGYIAGDGNGHFFPGRNVSSVEFGIMLLRLLGYDAKNEGLVGDQWATKGAALARKAGLTTSVAANTQPMTRDAMAQMAFNVLTATLVEYNGLNGTIGDATFSSPASPRYHNANDLGISNLTYDGKVPSATTTIKFCEEHFPNLKLVTGSRDDFEREYSVWTWKNVDIAGSKQIVTANFEFTEKKSSVNLNGAAGDANTEVYINGKPQSADDIKAIQSALSATQTGYVTSGVVAYLTQNGRQVLVYLNENNYKDIDKVVVIDTFVARVSAVSSANETTTVSTMSAPGTLDSRTVEMTGYAVGDIVAYTAAWNGSSKYVIQEMDVLTDPVTGTLTKWSGTSVVDADPTKGNSQSNFTIDSGDPYKYSYRKAIRGIDGSDVEIYSFTANKSELNVYLDKYGFALYVEGVEGEKNYAAVIGIGESNAYGSATKGVTLLLADSTTVEATAKLASGLAWSDFKGNNAGTIGAWGGDSKNLVTDGVADIVTYTVDSKGVYTLTLVVDPSNTVSKTGNYSEVTSGTPAVTFKNGKSLLTIGSNNFYTTSKTIFMVCTGIGTNRTYHVYTGYANAPGIALATDVNGISYGLNRRYNNQIDVVYIDAAIMDNMTGASTYFVQSERPTVYTDSTGKYFVLPAIVDGEVTEIKIDAALTKTWNVDNERLDQADAGLYAIDGVQKDENDIITGCTLKTASAAFRATNDNNGKVGTVAANGEVLGWGTSTKTFWAYNDKTNVFFVDKDYKTITKMAVADVQDDENDLIYADHDGSSGDKKLSTVVIVEKDPTPDAVTYTVAASAHVEVRNANSGWTGTATSTSTNFNSGATVYVKGATGYAIDADATAAKGLSLTSVDGGVYRFAAQNVAADTIVAVEHIGYSGDIEFDITAPGTTTATWTGNTKPTEEELTVALIDYLVSKGYPKSTMTNSSAPGTDVEIKAKKTIAGVAGPEETFTLTLADGLIQTVTDAADLADLITAGKTAKVVLNVDATVTTTAPTMDIEVKSGKTLTLNGALSLSKDITGAGNVTIGGSGAITAGAKIKVSGKTTVQASGTIDDLTGITGDVEVKDTITVANGLALATGKTLTIADGKTLTLTAASTLSGSVTAGTGTNGATLILSGGGSVKDIANTVSLTNTSGALSITGTATPKALTQTAGVITVAAGGKLTLPATFTTAAMTDNFIVSGELVLGANLTVAASKKIDVAATGTIDFNGKTLTGAATSADFVIASGATVKNFDASAQNFYANDGTQLATDNAIAAATYSWNTDVAGDSSNVAGWKSDT